MSNRRRSPLKNLEWRVLLKMLLALAGYVAAGIFIYYAARSFYSIRSWQRDDLVYILFHFIYDRIWFFVLLYALGCIPIFLHFWRQPFRYLEETAEAADALYSGSGEMIELPPPLASLENRLNQARVNMANSERIAKEAEQRKNDLVTYLAHDLKTPITSVIGYLMLLRDEPDIPAEQRARYVGIALDKAERLEELINEFFDITRFSLSKLTLEPERVNLSRMMEQISYEFTPLLADKELKIQTGIEPDIEIFCDVDKLERVFDNLIRNAVSYSYPKTDIHITLRRIPGGAEIRVRNTGKTIPKEKLERIFERFFRLDSARSSSTGGAGLGLAIAKEIVELHGGSISAESRDESIEFTLLLPEKCKEIV